MAMRRRHASSPWQVLIIVTALVLGAIRTGHAAPVTVGYFGETLAHPGLQGGVEWRPWQQRVFALVLALESGFYIHPQNHSGIFARATTGIRAQSSFGLSGILAVGAGYLHTFRGGDVYNDRGQQMFDWGRPSFMPSVSLEGAWTLTKIHGIATSPFLRAMVFGQLPYNGGLLERGALILGVRFE